MQEGTEQAIQMLDTFASVGVRSFDLTLTDLRGANRHFRRSVHLPLLHEQISAFLYRTLSRQQNLIVRPGETFQAVLLQLDDLPLTALQRVQPAAFLCLQTSPENYQAWIAVSEYAGQDLLRRVRRATGADPTASGATRVAGSRNFKAKYAPDFPRVEIAYRTEGAKVTPAQLEDLGLVAPLETTPFPARRKRAAQNLRGKAWPSYERCLREAPAKHDHSGPDVSRADFTWCLIALDWGFGIEDTAARLMEESSKARENGERYANRTAERAAAALALRHGKPHNGPLKSTTRGKRAA